MQQKIMDSESFRHLVDQRVRNRIIEILDLFADEKYFELAISNLEFWADFVDTDEPSNLSHIIFNEREIEDIIKVNSAWEHVSISSSKNSNEWLALNQAATAALKTFMERGMFSETQIHA